VPLAPSIACGLTNVFLFDQRASQCWCRILDGDVPALQVHPVEVSYPLRPELLESAYALYVSTGEPRYLRTGSAVLETIATHNRCKCGFCSVRNVSSGALTAAVVEHACTVHTSHCCLQWRLSCQDLAGCAHSHIRGVVDWHTMDTLAAAG
jgi:hypothetical protein